MIVRKAILLYCYLSWRTVEGGKTPVTVITKTLRTLRAGDGGNATLAKKKKKKKKTKAVIQEVLTEKDSAKALGDAVRYVDEIMFVVLTHQFFAYHY